MRTIVKTFVLCVVFWAAAGEPVTAAGQGYEIRVMLIGGQKFAGTPDWKDSSVIIHTKDKTVQEIRYRDIQSMRFIKNRNMRMGAGALIGAPVGGIGTVIAVNQFVDVADAWDPRPMFGLMGGCCAGGCIGVAVGGATAYNKKMDIIGDHGRFQMAREQWKKMTGT